MLISRRTEAEYIVLICKEGGITITTITNQPTNQTTKIFKNVTNTNAGSGAQKLDPSDRADGI